MPVYLNFGCGSVQPDGWINVDRLDFGQGKDYRADAGDHDGLWWIPDGTVDGIVASHSLQENGYDELPAVLAELRRVLKPGGRLRVLWPDVAAAFAAWERNDRAWFPVNDQEPSIDDALCVYLNWFGSALTLCTPPRLITLLARAGFNSPHLAPFGHSTAPGLADLDDREPEQQIIVEATK
jgi:SAM-dependent methyltransferase